MKKIATGICAGFFLQACVITPATLPTVQLPDGGIGHSLSCVDIQNCYRQAGRECRGAYTIVDRAVGRTESKRIGSDADDFARSLVRAITEEDSEASETYSSPRPETVETTETKTNMVVKCKKTLAERMAERAAEEAARANN